MTFRLLDEEDYDRIRDLVEAAVGRPLQADRGYKIDVILMPKDMHGTALQWFELGKVGDAT